VTPEITKYTALVKTMTNDKRITATHLSLVGALIVCWQASGFRNPFSACRKPLMAFSKIASTATYHKCIKQLNDYGYIRYKPSYHPVRGSQIHWAMNQNE
jgi:hypothetical protein